ncbi:MAG: GIY-YIG nuclease family protein [Proteobacteria bacterium]|nr:GIY-YIG nuclease family protein [Pseudomonadota bacterium]
MITIQELLYNRGLDRKAKVKLVRHQDKRYPNLYEWYRFDRQKFLTYQNGQGKDVFKDVDYIASFIGEGSGTLSRFVGIFKITGKKELDKPTQMGSFFIYEMEDIEGFEDLKERVIIKWSNAISWHQWIKNEMEVIEIHPGLHYKQFTDYFDFILNFEELKDIVTNEYIDWKRMLSATKGIYLISDTKTGKLYVGSAYGENGIWGRWSEYVKTNGHGGNKTLKGLIENDPTYGNHFQFSVLMLLQRTITPDEAIKKERLFKDKLGTNSFGLNNN